MMNFIYYVQVISINKMQRVEVEGRLALLGRLGQGAGLLSQFK